MIQKEQSNSNKITYHGWMFGKPEDRQKLREFGFTGEMYSIGEGLIEYVNATSEVMERACREIPNFNYRSFTAVNQNGKQLPFDQQIYWSKPEEEVERGIEVL